MLYYLIRSKASAPDSQGVRKFSFASEQDGEVFLFLWVNQEGFLHHLQLVYDEQVLSWKPDSKFDFAKTNRTADSFGQVGRQKGSRTLIGIEDQRALLAGVDRLKQIRLPEPFDRVLEEALVF